MKKILTLLVLLLLTIAFLSFGRSIYMPILQKIKGKESVESTVEIIEEDVYARLKLRFEKAGLTDFPNKLILLALKEEKILQVYSSHGDQIKFLKTYPFTATSGILGPKLKEGDKQIPEGIYKVEYLNPNSAYYLSLKVNYPNEYDKSKTELAHINLMGGDIFIHGKAASIGCIPIGDIAIEEVFMLAQKAFDQEIKVIISPRDFRKNESYPAIESIEWEQELYDNIKTELLLLPTP